MQSVIGALRVNLGIDTAAFSDGLKSAQNSLKSVGAQMQRTGALLSAAVTAPLVGIGVKSVAAFQKQEQALAAVEAAVRSTGGAAGFSTDQLAKMASELQNVTTFGDEDILNKVTANLLTFTNVQGDVFRRAQVAAADLSARLGQDLQSSAIMLGKALNDPLAGLTALSRVGVSFTEEQKELVKALVEGGNAAEAQGVILDLLAEQYGGQAQALAETVGGQQTQAWNALGDALESVGAVIAEFIPPIAAAIKSAAEAFQALSPETRRFIVIGGAIAAALGPALAALGLFVAAIGALSAPVIAAVAAVAGLTAAAIAFWPEIEAAGGAVAAFAEEVWTGIADIAGRLDEALGGYPSLFLEIGSEIIAGLWRGLTSGFAMVRDGLTGFATGLVGDVKSMLGIQSPSTVFAEIGEDMMEGLRIGVEAGAPSVRSEIGGLADDLESPLRGAFDGAGNALADFVTKGKADFGSLVDSIVQDITRLAIQSAIVQPLMGALGGIGAGGGGSAPGLFGGGGGLLGLFGGLFANGAAFLGGRVTAFASGGVVNGPTMFPMRGGVGLMGEAGAEAIMPLDRGPGGKLGVNARGLGGHVFNFHFPNSDPDQFRRSEAQVAATAGRAISRAERRNG